MLPSKDVERDLWNRLGRAIDMMAEARSHTRTRGATLESVSGNVKTIVEWLEDFEKACQGWGERNAAGKLAPPPGHERRIRCLEGKAHVLKDRIDKLEAGIW